MYLELPGTVRVFPHLGPEDSALFTAFQKLCAEKAQEQTSPFSLQPQVSENDIKRPTTFLTKAWDKLLNKVIPQPAPLRIPREDWQEFLDCVESYHQAKQEGECRLMEALDLRTRRLLHETGLNGFGHVRIGTDGISFEIHRRLKDAVVFSDSADEQTGEVTFRISPLPSKSPLTSKLFSKTGLWAPTSEEI